MNKGVLAISCLLFSAAAFAAPTTITGGPVTPTECSMLAESVNLSTSANVVGAYNCIDGVNKEINVATCSTGGRTSPRTVFVACNAANLPSTSPNFIEGAPQCDANGRGPSQEVRGANIYAGSTAGGTIAPTPEATVCNATQVQAATRSSN
ncbi:hypothetical protein [Stutzerimonas stutzeri]|uniref:hypothetical protein n=1 Tax=Stutzerimonas stutzeri TaxID=316 RepID=UPI00244B570C|nr:hypothetical protein [Stutzerimonas stutzeri]MDH0425963.1 hypothetical protein [Stutzerimonas stutzeri]